MTRGFIGALSLSATFALLAGCGGSQPPIGAPGAILQRHETDAVTFRTSHQTGDVLFVSGVAGCAGPMALWQFPSGHFIKCVQGISGRGLCSDLSGNVWVADNGVHYLEELDHQGNLIGGFQDQFGVPTSCSIDPTTGRIAVTQQQSGAVRIYNTQYGSGKAYKTNLAVAYFCGYDDAGNLFVDGVTARNHQGELVELPSKAKSFRVISLDRSITGTGGVQWDGEYVAVEIAEKGNTATIDRISVSGSRGTVVGSTALIVPKLRARNAAQFWIQGGTIVRPAEWRGAAIGEWAYPAGGKAKHLIRRAGSGHVKYAYGLTVSPAQATEYRP